jgi:hypothetical protein
MASTPGTRVGRTGSIPRIVLCGSGGCAMNHRLHRANLPLQPISGNFDTHHLLVGILFAALLMILLLIFSPLLYTLAPG